MTGKRLISAAEAARQLGVDKATVARWCQQGKIPAVRTLGGHWRIRATVVHGMMEGLGPEDREEETS